MERGDTYAIHLDQEHRTRSQLGQCFEVRLGYIKLGGHSHEEGDNLKYRAEALERSWLAVPTWEPSAVGGS